MLLSVVFEYVAAGGFAGEQISGEGGVMSLMPSTFVFLIFRGNGELAGCVEGW